MPLMLKCLHEYLLVGLKTNRTLTNEYLNVRYIHFSPTNNIIWQITKTKLKYHFAIRVTLECYFKVEYVKRIRTRVSCNEMVAMDL